MKENIVKDVSPVIPCMRISRIKLKRPFKTAKCFLITATVNLMQRISLVSPRNGIKGIKGKGLIKTLYSFFVVTEGG